MAKLLFTIPILPARTGDKRILRSDIARCYPILEKIVYLPCSAACEL